jgi:hypothetical protein
MSKITIRDIIVNACDAARLVNRNQPIPGNIFLSAYTMLQRRLDSYSNTHLLSFTQKEANIDTSNKEIVLGKFVPKPQYEGNVFIVDDIAYETPTNYNVGNFIFDRNRREMYTVNSSAEFVSMGDGKNIFAVYPDVELDDLHEILKCYVNGNEDYDRWIELSFVAFEDFYDRAYGCGVYTVNIKSDDEQVLKVKEPVTFQKLKIIYTAPFDFDADTELNIPRQYIALFTAGLIYDLATAYPRLGDSTIAMLKQRLDELEENVRTSSSVNKFIGREINWRGMTYADFKNGTFLI